MDQIVHVSPQLPSQAALEPAAQEQESPRQQSYQVLNGWRRWESNPRPPACKAGALPTELRPRETVSRHQDDDTISPQPGMRHPCRRRRLGATCAVGCDPSAITLSRCQPPGDEPWGERDEAAQWLQPCCGHPGRRQDLADRRRHHRAVHPGSEDPPLGGRQAATQLTTCRQPEPVSRP